MFSILQKITFFTLAAMLLVVSPAFAQGRAVVTGHIVDAETGKPLAGTISINGRTEESRIIDAEGRFAIRAAVGKTLGHLPLFAGTPIPFQTKLIVNRQNITYLHCSRMKLTALNVSKNTRLTYLNCGDNVLTTLDVSNCTALERLWCGGNQLTVEGYSVHCMATLVI